MPLARACVGVAMLLASFAAACDGETGLTAVDLSWRFVDDRPCDLAGVVDVFVTGSSEFPSRFRCVDGSHPTTVSFSVPDDGTPIVAEARSVTGAVLYRGEGGLVEGRGALRLTLRFIGGAGSPL